MPRLPRTKRATNPEGRMAVMDHLRELRHRIIMVILFVVAGAILGYIFYNPILHVLKGPYCHVNWHHRYGARGPNDCSLVFRDPLGGFTVRLKVSFIAGAILTAPASLYQLWAFVTPGLRKNERKWTMLFIFTSTALFVLGVVLAFATLYTGLNVLIGSAGSGVQAQLDVASYIGFVTMVLVVFGVSFELPLVIVMLNAVRILPYSVLKKGQRVGIFLVFLFAAVATPSTDPFTMMAMALPMLVLFEAAVLWAFFHDRRRLRREVEEERAQAAATAAAMDDDIPSTIDPIPSPLDDAGVGTGPRSDYTDLP